MQKLKAFDLKDLNGNQFDLAKELQGAKALMIVNMGPDVCGFTAAHLTQLSEFYDKLHRRGLRIIAFPCDQFHAKGVG